MDSRFRGKDGSWLRGREPAPRTEAGGTGPLTDTGYLSNSIFLTAWNSPPACKR